MSLDELKAEAFRLSPQVRPDLAHEPPDDSEPLSHGETENWRPDEELDGNSGRALLAREVLDRARGRRR